ncbi:hypothetical protein A2U01_0086326, partial [Trifolium medium]|nr:hypothetical protein [Trifolium medium]
EGDEEEEDAVAVGDTDVTTDVETSDLILLFGC